MKTTGTLRTVVVNNESNDYLTEIYIYETTWRDVACDKSLITWKK